MNINYFRQRLEADDDIEDVEKGPVLRNYLMATQSDYGEVLDDTIRSFVSKEETLTDVDIQGINVQRPRELMVNLNSFALLFKKIRSTITKTPGVECLITDLEVRTRDSTDYRKKKEIQYQEDRKRVEQEKRRLKKVIKKMIVMIVTMIKTTKKYRILRLMLMEALILYHRLSCQVSLT